jgi:hypothetical protein
VCLRNLHPFTSLLQLTSPQPGNHRYTHPPAPLLADFNALSSSDPFSAIVLCIGQVAFGANCQAKGHLSYNSAGFGSGGTTNTQSASVTLIKDGKEVGIQKGSLGLVCTDIKAITSQLPYTFNWAASCTNAITCVAMSAKGSRGRK